MEHDFPGADQCQPLHNLQGLTKKGPRGLSRKSFEDCVMFHLLIVFPNITADVLYQKRAEETPAHQHSSVCAACGAAQLLHLATALLVLQPTREAKHDSYERALCRG